LNFNRGVNNLLCIVYETILKMIPPTVEKRIVNFVNKSANADELKDLEIWIRDPRNQNVFKEYVKTHFILILSKSNSEGTEEIRSKLLQEIRKEKRRAKKLHFRSIYKYAASIVLLATSGYFIYNQTVESKADQILVPKEETITLQLGDGTTKVINENGAIQITDTDGNIVGKQQGGKLVYEDKLPVEKLVYNTLIVPYGKRFDLILSDGTHVFLNAGTSLKYPVQFISGHNRSVFLNGEAFFDVSKDKEHPFVVNAEGLSIDVLGTKFNVANYKEDTHTEVVLVEGSVGLSPSGNPGKEGNENLELHPGFKGSFHKLDRTISSKKVNTSIYTGWLNGDVVFRNARFENIARRLERLYNVTIVNNNEELNDEIFNASFEVDNEGINDILRYFKKVYNIEYKIADDKIIID